MNKISNRLINNCPEDQRGLLRAQFNEDTILKRTLLKTIAQKLETIRREREAKKTFLSPNWEYQQADAIGEIRGLKFLLDILS